MLFRLLLGSTRLTAVWFSRMAAIRFPARVLREFLGTDTDEEPSHGTLTRDNLMPAIPAHQFKTLFSSSAATRLGQVSPCTLAVVLLLKTVRKICAIFDYNPSSARSLADRTIAKRLNPSHDLPCAFSPRWLTWAVHKFTNDDLPTIVLATPYPKTLTVRGLILL